MNLSFRFCVSHVSNGTLQYYLKSSKCILYKAAFMQLSNILTVLHARETASVAYITKGRQYDFISSTMTNSA